METLLTTAYYPNIQYISKILLYKKVYIEQHENYLKQTYRNRCEILSANGRFALTIPVIQKNELKTKISEIEISYAENWQKLHFKALESAYSSSPFYEFYIHDFIKFFEKKPQNLFEYNTEILYTILEIIGIAKTKISFTNNFIELENNYYDFRFSITPKKQLQTADNEFKTIEYTQVFAEKFKFDPNLSILDLIFNLGPESLLYLKKTLK
jgi:hypothetical protein